jgi:hypothetical protein
MFGLAFGMLTLIWVVLALGMAFWLVTVVELRSKSGASAADSDCRRATRRCYLRGEFERLVGTVWWLFQASCRYLWKSRRPDSNR